MKFARVGLVLVEHRCRLRAVQRVEGIQMFSLDGYQAVELSPLIKPRIHRVDGSIEEGEPDPHGRHWVMEEGRFAGDNSLFTLFRSPPGDTVWEPERMSAHMGSHVQGGKGHISHWKGTSPDMKGIWEMPVETFIGEAAVCNLAALSPKPITDASQYPCGEGWFREKKDTGAQPHLEYTNDGKNLYGSFGLEILPEHLGNIQIGDIVLMTSPFKGFERPWLSKRTAEWLIEDRRIKMLGLGLPGIEWEYDLKKPAPDNSPIRRMLLGANCPIAHPLVNIEKIKSDRVFYVGMPFNFKKFEASFIRAVAFEPQERAS